MDQAAANALIAEANVALSEGELDRAAQAYRAAIERFPAYGSYELVIGDAYYDADRLPEAIEAYQATVDAVPEHDQAWERLAECLHRMGRTSEAQVATAHYEALRSALREVEDASLLDALAAEVDINRRAEIICELAYVSDDASAHALHRWLGEVAHDRQTGRHGSGNTFWSAVAFTLVRFGMADFVDWYTDGPAPSEAWLMKDVAAYLRTHRHGPPALDRHQPIHMYPT